jgi:hypothetical protein
VLSRTEKLKYDLMSHGLLPFVFRSKATGVDLWLSQSEYLGRPSKGGLLFSSFLTRPEMLFFRAPSWLAPEIAEHPHKAVDLPLLALLGDLKNLVLLGRQVILDRHLHQRAKASGRNGVKLDRDGAEAL